MISNNKRLPAHPMTLCNSICIRVKHESIKNQNISGVMEYANLFSSSEQNAWNCCGNIRLVFSGYSNDPRELWEIPEVRAYVSKLLSAWPEWMFYLASPEQTMRVCIMCVAQMERTSNPNVQNMVGLSPDVLVDGFNGLNELCDKYQFGDDVCEIINRKVATCIGIISRVDAAMSSCDESVIGSAS